VTPGDVPPGPLVVDTDVFSMWYRQRGRSQDFEDLTSGHALAMSFACVAEALAPTYVRKGIAVGTTQRIRNALARFVVIPFDDDIVERWAQMAGVLEGRLKGRGINDMWTAACALSHGFPVVTNNLSDFQTIQTEFPDLGLVHPHL
jgi:predicted nucleic acid-binding protein